MKLVLVLVKLFLFNGIQCFDSESMESYNGIEVSPFYDAIIFSDIADIINEFENNNIPITTIAKNESESNEDVDDLLSEYQHYLERAHKQTKDYIEKTKSKNKVPLFRHEKYSKSNNRNSKKRDDFYYKTGYYNPDILKITKSNPLDILLPFTTQSKPSDLESLNSPFENHDVSKLKNVILNEDKPLASSFPPNPIISCYCKSNKLPCSCGCKTCLLPMDALSNKITSKLYKSTDEEKMLGKDTNYFLPNDNTLNIRIKVEFQLPNLPQQRYTMDSELGNGKIEKSLPIIKLPLPYFNFPMPMNVLEFKNNLNSNQFHKLTIHKKKKSKPTNSRKHRKKMITFHNIKIEPQQLYEAHFRKQNLSNEAKNETSDNNMMSTESEASTTQIVDTTYSTAKLLDSSTTNTQTDENIFFLVNISSNIVNGTDESKLENSLETESNIILHTTTLKSVHQLSKREVNHTNTDELTKKKTLMKTEMLPKNNSNIKKTIEKKQLKKNEKSCLPNEAELLYWPLNNEHANLSVGKNITAIIMETENKKAKVNMTNELLKNNHSQVLEKAIFGEVNWNNIEAVAPAFISFVGKYMQGMLTFCSEKVCHSMKCGKEKCMYRICKPEERLNNKGHCTGTNSTDSVTSMGSIMDLPSNIAFDVVHILEDRMIGKLFGKVTLCINSKCITFAACKKTFMKIKCTLKELNSNGHCKSLIEEKHL